MLAASNWSRLTSRTRGSFCHSAHSGRWSALGRLIRPSAMAGVVTPHGSSQKTLLLNIGNVTSVLSEVVRELSCGKSGVLNVFTCGTDAAMAVHAAAVSDDVRKTAMSVGGGSGECAAAILGHSCNVPVRDGKLMCGDDLILHSFGKSGADAEEEVVATFTPATASAGPANLKSRGGGVCDLVTRDIAAVNFDSKAANDNFSLVHVTLGGGPTSVCINENADPDVRVDLAGALQRIAPRGALAAAIVGGSLAVPCGSGGRPGLGTWQGLYLNNHGDIREAPFTKTSTEVCAQTTITATAPKRGCHDITSQVEGALAKMGGASAEGGAVHIFIKHTSASLCVGGAASLDTLETALSDAVPVRLYHTI